MYSPSKWAGGIVRALDRGGDWFGIMQSKANRKPAPTSVGARPFAPFLILAALASVALPSSAQWSAVGGDQGNTRYSSLTQINSQNIAKLGAAWISEKVGPPPSSRAMPVIDDGLLFLTAPPFVTAVDIVTGKIAWQYRLAPDTLPGAPVAGSPAREGVAVGEGLVFVGLSDSNLIALHEKSGELVWKHSLIDPAGSNTGGPSGAPLYADGLVSIGTNGDNGNRGQIVALDAKTGKETWRFFVIPAPGEPGSETWPKNDSWKRGGGAVWLVGATDPSMGLDFYVTGNGVPQYGGENRAGDNLYLCSVLALDSKTGKLRWHYQVIRHDIWEVDIAEAPVLFDAQVSGQPRKAIAAMRTDGYLFLLDRATGKPLGRVEDRRVAQDPFQKTAATQPYPVGADPVLPDCDDWKKQTLPRGFELGCFFTPATIGKENVIAPVYGMRATPMAFDPQTRFFYATGNAGLQWFRRSDDPDFFGMGFNSHVPGISKLSYGVLAAIDTRTDKIAWEKKFPGGRPSGALATAGGLIFQMAGDGNMQAYDATTGSLIWQFQTGTASGSPPIAFESAGDEYIATVIGGAVWAFKLGGALPQRAGPVIAAPEEFGGAVVDATLVETSTMVRDAGLTGAHYMIDEYEFTPLRARIKAGARVTWRNNGKLVHTIVAEDGSWTTGPLHPLDFASVKFDKPGTYTYICKEYPWVYGQIIVEPAAPQDAQNQSSGK
ncbi:MAG TPA: PQQ-binding-like beta-propeller repeat protein [Candidatus Acidoferrales bacterium]|nr:PQQ-binding-like beta-propeller repeat protein [Candidatus Acidoferrales bacterium]